MPVTWLFSLTSSEPSYTTPLTVLSENLRVNVLD